MFYKKYTSIALLISLLVTPVFCAKKKTFNSYEYETDQLIEKLFSKKKAKDPEAIYKGISILLNDNRFDKDSIVKTVNVKLNYLSFDAILSDFGKTVLYYAAEAGNNKAIDIIFTIWNRDPWSLLSKKETHYGYTPLHIAVIHGHIKTVKKLLKISGPNAWVYIQAHDNNGWNTFSLAAENNRKEIFSIMLKKAPDEKVIEDLYYKAVVEAIYWFKEYKSSSTSNY